MFVFTERKSPSLAKRGRGDLTVVINEEISFFYTNLSYLFGVVINTFSLLVLYISFAIAFTLSSVMSSARLCISVRYCGLPVWFSLKIKRANHVLGSCKRSFSAVTNCVFAIFTSSSVICSGKASNTARACPMSLSALSGFATKYPTPYLLTPF